jgi:tryptophan synthase beta chain
MMSTVNENGFFGEFGGRFIPPQLIGVLDEVKHAFLSSKDDPVFKAELDYYLKNYVGRKSPLYFAEKLTEK